MKKHFMVLLAIVLTMASTTLVKAEEKDLQEKNIVTESTEQSYTNEQGDKVWENFTYHIVIGKTGECAELTGLVDKEKTKDLILPDQINGLPVTYIQSGAFERNDNIRSLVLNKSIKDIGYYAFDGCSNLTGSIVIPSSVENLGKYAFANTPIQEVVIEDSEEKLDLGDMTFEDCTSLEKVSLGNRINRIGVACFENDTKLTDITYTQNNYDVSIDSSAFSETGIESVTLPSNVVSIGSDAFWNCKSLKSVQLDNNLKTIGIDAFSDCTSLSELSLNEGLTTIGRGAFENCSNLSGKLTIPSTITLLEGEDGGNGIFSNTGITEVEFLDGTDPVTIGDSVFFNCKDLKKVIFPRNLSKVGNFCFYAANKLTDVVFKDGDYDLSIGDHSFVEIPITSLKFPKNTTSIGNNAFCSCDKLKYLELNEGLKTIGSNAFTCCHSLNIVLQIPSTVSEIKGIDYGQFGNFYSRGEGAFESSGIIGVEVADGDTPLTIGYYAFHDCENLKYANLSNRVNVIQNHGFGDAPELEWVKIKDGKNEFSIEYNAFQNDGKLKYITLPIMTKIEKNAFLNCMSLSDVYYSASNEDYAKYVSVADENDQYKSAYIHTGSTGSSIMQPTKPTSDSSSDSSDNQSVLYTGWKKFEGKYFWYENGVLQGYDSKNSSYRGKEIYDPETNAWYWLDNMQGGAKAVDKDVYQESNDGKWVRYDKDGHMVKGWNENSQGKYYFDLITGAMLKGNQKIQGTDYYFDPNTGILQTGEINPEHKSDTSNNKTDKLDHEWYSEQLSTGETVYYWYENGIRQGYDPDNSSYRGKEIYDAKADAWFWLDNVQQGARAVNKDVYQESNGGKWVRYDADGYMIKGWNTKNGNKYYFDLITGAMYKGWHNIGGTDYYFNEDTGILE